MYDDTCFSYFITKNLLACDHHISTEKPKTMLRYRLLKVAVSSHYTGTLILLSCYTCISISILHVVWCNVRLTMDSSLLIRHESRDSMQGKRIIYRVMLCMS